MSIEDKIAKLVADEILRNHKVKIFIIYKINMIKFNNYYKFKRISVTFIQIKV